jgi:hypothetical protein
VCSTKSYVDILLRTSSRYLLRRSCRGKSGILGGRGRPGLAFLAGNVQALPFDALDLDDDSVLHGYRHVPETQAAEGVQDMIEGLAKVFVAGFGDGHRRISLGTTGHMTPGLALR